MLSVVAIVLFSALLLTHFQKPVYTSTGRLVVAGGEPIVSATERMANQDFVQTEIQFLKSEGQ